MQHISVFDIIKIGIGPSSSHTMGPWNATNLFKKEITENDVLPEIQEVHVVLYGSLAKTGEGHGTHIAVMLGLMGEDFATIDTTSISKKIDSLKQTKKINLFGEKEIDFDPDKHIIFDFQQSLPKHPNGLTIKAICTNGRLYENNYYSVGGGFVETDDDFENEAENHFVPVYDVPKIPYPYETADDVSTHCAKNKLAIHELVIANELVYYTAEEIQQKALLLWIEIKNCIYRGINAEGILPGGLNVRRRAQEINGKLLQNSTYDSMEEWIQCIKKGSQSFNTINKWISTFALAVNEENAAFGRIVTAPTNGAAGVIPAVMMYAHCFTTNFKDQKAIRFLLTAGLIGVLFKKKATISAAMGGCQAEIGVSSAMAAAALTECMGGSVAQVMMAAEIAMEHHLGMTCDPIAGLVQIPCIERNSMGAIKAITASNIALESDPANARVSLDHVIQSMWQTALDMNSKYKETAEGGLAVNIPVNVAEC